MDKTNPAHGETGNGAEIDNADGGYLGPSTENINTPSGEDTDADAEEMIAASSRRPRDLEEAQVAFDKGIARIEAMCTSFPRGVRPVHAIRRRCIDCCGGSSREVDLCPDQACPSWPYRFGRSPFTKLGVGKVPPKVGKK